MIARTGKHISSLLQEIYRLTGRLYAIEENLPATPEMRIVVPDRLREVQVDQILGCPVLRTSHVDGFKFYLEHDNWVMLRFSGTEALLRIFSEADTPEKAQALIEWGKRMIDL